eukprot:COSAG02_NODE_60070_length_272_cov_0.838150_1_plen_35_part_10
MMDVHSFNTCCVRLRLNSLKHSLSVSFATMVVADG